MFFVFSFETHIKLHLQWNFKLNCKDLENN